MGARYEVEKVLRWAEPDELLRLCDIQGRRARARRALDDPATATGERADAHRQLLSDLPPVTAIDALEATAKLARQIDQRRFLAMRDAREEGAPWSRIGRALGISKQAAQEFYTRHLAAHGDGG